MPTSRFCVNAIFGRLNPGILGPANSGEGRMLSRCNKPRCGRAAMTGVFNAWTLVLAMVFVVCVGSSAGAQTLKPAEVAQTDQPPIDIAIDAFITARQWIDTFETPALDEPASRLKLPNCSGVYVALRGGAGRVVGESYEIAPLKAGESPNDVLMLRRAMGKALSQALGDSAVRNLPEEVRASVGRELTLELEIAGPLRPMLARTNEQVASQYEPGLDGLAMRSGQKMSIVFPAQLRRSGTAGSAGSAVARLASDLGLTAEPLEKLIAKHNVSLYRFRAVHLVQENASAPPSPTQRGLRVIGTLEVTKQSVARFADAIAMHLVQMQWTGDEPLGLRGDYDALREQYVPLIAPPRDQALAAFALLRYGKSPGAAVETKDAARNTAIQLLNAIADVQAGEDGPYQDAASCAMIVCAVAELPAEARDEELLSMMRKALAPMTKLTTMDDAGVAGALGHLTGAERGMIAIALVKACEIDPGADHCAMTRRYLNILWNTADDDAIAAHLPWLGWAEIGDAQLAGASIQHAAELKRIRLALWQQQVNSAASPVAINNVNNTDWLDLVGGFRLSTMRAAPAERPTSQSARPAALIATLLRNEQLTGESERETALQSHRLTMRYLMQLQVTDDDAWLLKDLTTATGGIRRNTWDYDLPNAASAMALLTAAETLLSLDELGRSATAVWSAGFGSDQ